MAVALAGYALSEQLLEAKNQLRGVDWRFAAMVVVGLIIYQLVNASVWTDVLRSIGCNVKRSDATKVWIESESLKWLPGGLWGYGSRVVSSGSLGVQKRAASLSLVWELMLTNLAWGGLALSVFFSAPIMQAVADWAAVALDYGAYFWMSLVLMCIVFLGGCYFVISRYKEKLTCLLDIRQFDLKVSAGVFIKYFALCVYNTSLFYLACLAIPGGGVNWLSALAIGSSAWIVGFWAIGVPGGIGVREAFIVLLMQLYIPVESAIAVAVLWRILQMVSEIAGVLLVVMSRQKQTIKPQEASHERA